MMIQSSFELSIDSSAVTTEAKLLLFLYKGFMHWLKSDLEDTKIIFKKLKSWFPAYESAEYQRRILRKGETHWKSLSTDFTHLDICIQVRARKPTDCLHVLKIESVISDKMTAHHNISGFNLRPYEWLFSSKPLNINCKIQPRYLQHLPL